VIVYRVVDHEDVHKNIFHAPNTRRHRLPINIAIFMFDFFHNKRFVMELQNHAKKIQIRKLENVRMCEFEDMKMEHPFAVMLQRKHSHIRTFSNSLIY
jgi:hypothetical protein